MKKSLDFHDFVVYDIFGGLPNISSRHMMSGWAIYCDGVVFAAIIGNQLYLKTTNPELIEKLKNYGSHQFSYEKSDKRIVSMKYWLVPEDLFDDVQLIQGLAEEAVEENLGK